MDEVFESESSRRVSKKPLPAKVVLLVNLGTPSAPTASAVRRYLAQFLSDRRVIDLPRWLWLPLLYGVILLVRPRRSARLYQHIWTPTGSPLLIGTAALAHALQQRFDPAAVEIRYAMRYGAPDMATVMSEFKAPSPRSLVVLPLFPQYSAATTASVFDSLSAELRRWRSVPDLQFIADYHNDEGYIDALAGSVEAHWREHGRADRLLLSFHGIPQRYVAAGDPYATQCESTAHQLKVRLGLDADEITLCYQSRVGLETWLQPYTDATLRELPAQGIRRVQVLCPGFAIDCLETLEEIAMTNRDLFLGAGGERFEYIPALNAQPAHVAALDALIRRRLCGVSQ
ncbi:MAG: ferrochelatase [Dokdonella sp.]